MTLRVLHVLDHSVPLHSGYSFRTLSILREQRRLGWQTLQLTTPKQGKAASSLETVEGFQFVRTPPSGGDPLRQMLATARAVLRTAREFRPDVIHAHSPILTALPSLYAARRLRVPLVYEVRATWEDAAVDHGTTQAGSLRYRVSKGLETFVLRRADHVTTICEGLRREIVARGVPAASVTVIPNAVDVNLFSFGRARNAEMRRKLGIGDAAVAVGFIGSFYGYEGLEILLDALAILIRDGVDVHGVFVGGGAEEANLKQRAANLGLAGRAHFVGRVSHEEVQGCYDAVDTLVYPRKRTRLTDTVTPLKPLEAMAQGKLVIASDVGGHREMVRDRENGRLFPADDAAALAECLKGVLRDRSDWDAMLRSGRDYVRDVRNWQVSVAGYAGAYRAALGGRSHPAEILKHDAP